MPNLHIILTCDGGNGHKAAADAIKERATRAGDQYLIINTSQSGWFSGGGPNISPKWDKYFYIGLVDLGPPAARWWNWSQRTSNTELLRILASMRKFSSLSIPSFRYRTFDLLEKIEDIDSYSEVFFHNTQPNCLQAIASSIARYNRMVKANNQQSDSPQKNLVRYINHFTDMPTIQAKMFIEEMGKINVADLDDAQFELHTPPPIMNESDLMTDIPSEQSDALHRRIKKLYPKLYQDLKHSERPRVKFVDGPIRAEFLHRKDQPAVKEEGLSLQFANAQEHATLNSLFKAELGPYDAEKKRARLALNDDIEVGSLMLGSQASIEGTLSLIDEEVALAQATPDAKMKYLFVFCGENAPDKGLVLYNKTLEKAKKVNQGDQTRIKIIPLTNQSAPFIADLYSLADTVITRPGGISMMEIEAVAKKANIFLFSELSKLRKLADKMLLRTESDLKNHFSKQASNERLLDLVAWESGNARHAQNICRDEQGRTRVVPMNLYTYGRERLLCQKKKAIVELLKQNKYQEAFEQLSQDRALCDYFLTGNDEGTNLACISEVKLFNNAIIHQLEALVSNYPEVKTLKKGPLQTLALLQQTNKKIDEAVQSNTQPAEILKRLGLEIEKLKSSFNLSIEVVKNSKLEKKSEILRLLTRIAYGFTHFFRWLLGMQLKGSLSRQLESVKEDFVKTLTKAVSKRVYQSSASVDKQQVVDLRITDWDEIEAILNTKFEMMPDLKQKTFIIAKSEYPNLQHDFIYCYNEGEQSSRVFAIGRKLGKGGCGAAFLIQSKDEQNAVMKTHHPADGVPLGESYRKEVKCLKSVNAYLGDYSLSGQLVSIQKYVHGITFADYVVESKKGLFIKYKTFSEKEKLQIALAMANGLKVCLDSKIVHGDISPQNIMMQKTNMGNIQAVYIDFGNSQSVDNTMLTYRPYVSPYYGAPELLNAVKQYPNDKTPYQFPYSEKSDVYSLGIVLRDLGVDKPIVAQMIANNPNDRLDLAAVISTISEQLTRVTEDTFEYSTNLLAF